MIPLKWALTELLPVLNLPARKLSLWYNDLDLLVQVITTDPHTFPTGLRK